MYGSDQEAKPDNDEIIIDDLNITNCVNEIQDRGFTVVENFVSPDVIDHIRKVFDTEVPITEMRAIGTKTGRTFRAHNLLGKTRNVDFMFLDKRLRAIVEGIIGPRTQVNVTTLFNVLPGETRQYLHQDDGLWPIPRPHPPFLCNALLAIDDHYIENGATHLVPYSHKWHDRRVDQSIETTRVELKSGSIVFWEGGMWHGGGANMSNSRERLGFFMSHVVWYLRPQEIQLVSVPRDQVRDMPEQMQRLLGYHRFGLGVDGRDPIDVLNDGVVVHPSARVRWWQNVERTNHSN